MTGRAGLAQVALAHLPPGWRWADVCASEVLAEGGDGARFALPGPERQTGFAVRWRGQVFAYLNQCQHVPVELDWQEGKFFDAAGLYLVCATHGATYRADDGVCIDGPCVGRRLQSLQAVEFEGAVWVAMQSGNE